MSAADAGAGPGTGPRADELLAALEALRHRVEGACAAAGRDPAGVRVVVTTKTFPAQDVLHLAALGVRDVGEAREQEARAKRAEVLEVAGREARAGADELRWHFLGRLQRNKAAAVASWAHLVHSCDSERLAAALDRGAERVGRELPVLVQVDLAGEEGDAGRGGAPVGDVPALADRVAAAPGLRLAGVMAVAPRGADPAAAFDALAALADRVRADHPGADVVSAGMSEDLEQAVAAGATHLRVGRAVLGGRPPLR